MADNLPPSSAHVMESGSLNLPESSGPLRPVMGLLYIYRLHISGTTCSSSGGAAQQQLVYCVRVMSVGCYHDWSGQDWSEFHSNPGSSQQTYHARSIPIVRVAPPEDEQVVLETCRGC
jgi:hypothetical protein